KGVLITGSKLKAFRNPQPSWGFSVHKKTAPDGAVSGMPAIRETGPGKNLQAITVSCMPDKAFTPHPAT
ncbi:hypothetical protein, partial [Escherichia coli]|uniref:hypothetical protein n=1 Tax=Escherichia coli TaxID=562 RepID=UPI00137F48F9